MKMPSRCRPAWAAALLALVAVCATAALPAGGERGPVRRAAAAVAVETEARVIVKYKADAALMRPLSAGAPAVAPRHAQALSARLGLNLTDGRAIGHRIQVIKGRGLGSRQLAERIAAQADVEYAVVDGRKRALAVPNDPLFAAGQTSATPAVGQWYLRAPTSSTIVNASSVLASINAVAAWDVTTGSPSVVVAVLDTGVRKDHPDLAAKLLAGYDFIGGSGSATAIAIANDGDGRDADASDFGDWITAAETNTAGGVFEGCGNYDSNGDPTLKADSSWHGTQTAGLIGAATNNGVGMAGVGRGVMILPLRVLGKCGGYDSDILAAMLWAGGIATTPNANPNPARVINLSLGSAESCDPAVNVGGARAYVDAISQLNAAGVVVVAAAGNDGLTVGMPANCPGVIAVAGVRHSGTKVGYSDLGSEIAIAAPAGNCVNSSGACLYPLLTTSNVGTTTPVAGAAGAKYTGGGADASLGTSFSAPLVAGTVGLMFSANPTLTPAQVLAYLQSSARPFPQTGAGVGVGACTAPTSVAQDRECYCTTSTCGAGLLDAGAAVAAVAPTTAHIGVASTAAVIGSAVTLDGTGSRPAAGTSLATYAWTIDSGAAIAAFTSATNASTATLLPSAGGPVVVRLTVTDSAGQQSSSSVTLDVSAPTDVVPEPPPSSGGGGAMELGWLLGWLASVIGVRVVTPRRRRD
jgi:serine protease